eukprot:166166-Prorocentrum_minimum.AAC.1
MFGGEGVGKGLGPQERYREGDAHHARPGPSDRHRGRGEIDGPGELRARCLVAVDLHREGVVPLAQPRVV